MNTNYTRKYLPMRVLIEGRGEGLQTKLCWTPTCVCIAWHISGMFHLNMKTDHSTASGEQESSLRRETYSHYESFLQMMLTLFFQLRKK